jgi:uncharacterized membrane protein
MGMDPQQPGYGSPPPPPPYGAPVPPVGSAGSKWGPTSIGMEAHIAAGLSYIWILGIIFFFVEKSNRFVRFHAAQSILLGIASIALWIVWFIVGSVLSTALGLANTGTAGFAAVCVLSCIPALLGLVIFGFFLWGLIAGFSGRYLKMPIIGDIAERMAGGPIPA